MPDWVIFEQEEILPQDANRYFYIADDPKDAKKGWLYKFNPPEIKGSRNAAEYLDFYAKLKRKFGTGTLIRPADIQSTLGINKTKAVHVMQYLCAIGYADRYIAGVVYPDRPSSERRTFGVHYMLRERE